MIDEIKTRSLERYSLRVLFRLYNEHSDDRILGEIFLRTYSDLYNHIKAKIGLRGDPTKFVLLVYATMKEQILHVELKGDIESYLEKIVDGCLIVYSN